MQIITLPTADLERARAGEQVQVVRADERLNRGRITRNEPEETGVVVKDEIPRYIEPPYAEGEVVAVGEATEELWDYGDMRSEDEVLRMVYSSDGEIVPLDYIDAKPVASYLPAEHMPIEAARLWLRCVKVEVVRLVSTLSNDELNDIGTDLQEGGEHHNPHVWLLTFERTEP